MAPDTPRILLPGQCDKCDITARKGLAVINSPRHTRATRLWHWVNAVAMAVLFFSGLNISNAHPRLYWGQAGFDPAAAWLTLPRFPPWMTIPGYYSLADARLWHFLAAWPFAVAMPHAGAYVREKGY